MESDFCCRLCQKDMRVAGVLQHYTKLFQSSTHVRRTALSSGSTLVRRTALSSLPQNPAPEPSAPPALIQNTSLRCDWFSCHLPESWQCFQNLQWSGARPKCRQNILPSSSWRWFSRLEQCHILPRCLLAEFLSLYIRHLV